MRFSAFPGGLLAAAIVVSVLSACTPATPDWTSPGVGESETRAAWQACQAEARTRVNGSAGLDRPAGSDMSRGAPPSPLEDYDRRKAGRLYDRTVEACMRGKGFFPKKEQ